MTDREDAVREAMRYDAEHAVSGADAQRLLPPHRHGRSFAFGRVLAAAAVVAVIAATSVGIAHRHARVERTFSPPPPTTSKIGGLVFTLPPGGRFIGVKFLTAALFQPIGWIINQAPKPECERHANVGTCHGPYTSLLPGQYAVSFQSGPDMGQFHASTTIAGLPAAQGGTNGGCRHGFTTSIETSLDRAYPKSEPKGTLLSLTACFGADDPKLLRTIKAMITSAHR